MGIYGYRTVPQDMENSDNLIQRILNKHVEILYERMIFFQGQSARSYCSADSKLVLRQLLQVVLATEHCLTT